MIKSYINIHSDIECDMLLPIGKSKHGTSCGCVHGYGRQALATTRHTTKQTARSRPFKDDSRGTHTLYMPTYGPSLRTVYSCEGLLYIVCVWFQLL